MISRTGSGMSLRSMLVPAPPLAGPATQRTESSRSSSAPCPAASAGCRSADERQRLENIAARLDEESAEREIPNERLYGLSWNPRNYVAAMQAIMTPRRRPCIASPACSCGCWAW